MIDREVMETIPGIYEEVLQSGDRADVWSKIEPSWLNTLEQLCRPTLLGAKSVVTRRTAGYIAELTLLHIAIAQPKENGLRDLRHVLDLVERLMDERTASTRKLSKAFLEVLIVGLEALPRECAQEILDFLSGIVGAGVGRRSGRSLYRSDNPSYVRDLLSTGLYSVVLGFFLRQGMANPQEDVLAAVKSIRGPVISSFSTKGGTGKSTMLLAAACWFLDRQPNGRVCVLDLDLSGPTWQHMLFRETGKPKRFLDDILPMAVAGGDPFISLRHSDMMRAVETGDCFALGKQRKISHMGIRDIPYSCRLMEQCVSQNRSSFFPFLVGIVSALSSEYDLVLIDNHPGFDSLAFASLVLTGSMEDNRGLPIIVSTPTLPDLKGTFLELADVRLLSFVRSPVWVVNKSVQESDEYFATPRTTIEVAKTLRAYYGVIPSCPLVEQLPEPVDVRLAWKVMPMDKDLPTANYITKSGTPMPLEAGTEFVNKVFSLFDRELGDRMEGTG